MNQERKLRENLYLRNLGEEALLYDQGEKMVHVLNDTAALIFKLCSEGKTDDEIVAYFVKEFGVNQSEVESDVLGIMQNFHELKLFAS